VTRAPRIRVPQGTRPGDLGAVYRPELDRRLAALHAGILRLTALDTETTELVRLRCAQHHDCYG
jgi:hypothetical protein